MMGFLAQDWQAAAQPFNGFFVSQAKGLQQAVKLQSKCYQQMLNISAKHLEQIGQQTDPAAIFKSNTECAAELRQSMIEAGEESLQLLQNSQQEMRELFTAKLEPVAEKQAAPKRRKASPKKAAEKKVVESPAAAASEEK